MFSHTRNHSKKLSKNCQTSFSGIVNQVKVVVSGFPFWKLALGNNGLSVTILHQMPSNNDDINVLNVWAYEESK